MDQGVGSKLAAQDESTEPAGAAPSELPPYIAFSTRDIPVDGKFETWRDLWMRQLMEVDISTQSPESFEGELILCRAGPLAMARLGTSKATYERTASFARNGNNDFSFSLGGPNAYAYLHTSSDDSLQLPPSGGFFLAHERRFMVMQDSDYCDSVLLRIDRNALLELMPREFDPAMQMFAPGDRVLSLIANSVSLITSRTEPTTSEGRSAIGQQIVDLVAFLLNPSRDGRALIESRGLKSARIGAVLKEIDRRFADPSLSPDSLGAGLGISGRQVHRLLLETTKTFYEHLLERRLQQAHDLLRDPRHADLKVVDIAFKTGFTNASFFGQSYRRRFGDTPTGARAAVAAQRSLRVLRQSVDDK